MIVVFGSLNVDMVLPVETLPRPGNTVLCEEYKLLPGGKGANQAVAAAKAGAKVKMFGSIGNDSFAEIARQFLESTHVDISALTTSDRPTGCATICVDSAGENMITIASGANLQASSATIPDELLTENSTVLLQMEVPAAENWKLIERAKQRKSRIILNLAPAQPIPDELIQTLDILVMNQIEATVLALYLGFDVISPAIAARRLSSKYGITCIVTLGDEGAFACNPLGSWSVQALSIKPVDTTAAGDAFVGVLAAAFDKGLPIEQALRRAAVASGLACLNVGAQPSLPDAQQIDAALSRVPTPRRSI